MFDLESFYNAGTGWICKRCESELKETASDASEQSLPRVWREGEAETKQPRMASPLAKWTDAARNQLICPRCGITELIDKA